MIQKVKEDTADGFVIHLQSNHGDNVTICGYAEEGSAMPNEDDRGWKQVNRGKISCEQCLMLIRLCKKVPARMLCDPL